MSVVLDASAILAFVQGDDGADAVEAALDGKARCGGAAWSGVTQKVLAAGRDWQLVRALLVSYGIGTDPVVADDAEWAAHRWRRGEGRSQADRLCMALGERLDAVILTADTAWGRAGRARQIR